MASTSTNNFTAALERALKEHSLLQLNLYFSKTPNCSDVLNKANISMLMKILKRDRKHDNISIPVLCVLTCFERFLNSNIGVEIWQELSEDVSKLFDTTFILSAMYIEDSTLVERCTSLFTDIVEHSEQLADDSLKYMMKSLLKTATADKFASVRFEVVSFISVLLQKSSRELRREVVPSTINLLVKLSDTLVSCGNYELQATTVEVLARCRIYITDLQQSATVTLFPSNPRILDLFSNYTFLTFDSECRLFLNELNMSLATNKLVYSLPCMIIIVDNVQLRRPVDPLYTEFWVDFNSCPASISFYYLPPKGSLPDKETWDAFNIPFDCVTSVTAKKSQCRAKNSDSVVESVKLEIYRSTTPEHVKIYLVNDEHFETVETNILRKVLQDKYKSEIECTSDAKKPTQSTSQKPNKSKDVNMPKASFVNLSSVPEQLTSSKITEKTVIDDSDQDSPSPSSELKPANQPNTSSSYDNLLKTLENSDGNDSDSFAHYIKKKEEDSSQIGATGNNDLEENLESYLVKKQSKTVHDKTLGLDMNTETSKNRMSNTITKNISYTNDDGDVKNEARNKQTATASFLKYKYEESTMNVDFDDNTCGENNKRTDRGKPQILKPEEESAKSQSKSLKNRTENEANNQVTKKMETFANVYKKEKLEISTNNNIEKQQNYNTKHTSSKPKTLPEQKPQRTTRGVQQSQDNVDISNVNNSQQKDNPKSSVASKSVPRKRLYSVQNNDALMLSSQDDILLVDVPTYKISKKETKVKPQANINKKNVTYSYLNYKDTNIKKPKKVNEPSLYVDEKDIEEDSVNDNGTKYKKQASFLDQEYDFNYSSRNEKKLKALNKTPENTNSSNIFPTIYSDFSSSIKKPEAKKTYARQKPKRRGRKRIFLTSSSDSDSEYDPDAEVVQTREKRGRNTNLKKSCGFADRLENSKIDQTRDCSSTKSRKIEIEKVPFEETIETRIIFQKETIKAPAKIARAKNTRQASKSKLIINKCKEEIEKISEEAGVDNEPGMDIVPCQPEEINDILEDDWSLDVFHNPSSQDNKLLQATYKINDMVLVGKHCTSQVNTRLKKVHELAKKEREMNISAFDYNVQASISSVQTELKKLETATKTLASTKIALDSTFNLLKESALQLEADAAKIEHAKKELTKKLSQAEKTETSSINSIFQSFGRYMKNMVFSLLQSKQQNNRVIH